MTDLQTWRAETREDNVPEEFEKWLSECPVMWHRTGATYGRVHYESLTYTFTLDTPEEQETSND